LQGKVEFDGSPLESELKKIPYGEKSLYSLNSLEESLIVIDRNGEELHLPLKHYSYTPADHGILYIKNLMKTHPNEVTVADLKHLEDYANYVEKIRALESNPNFS